MIIKILFPSACSNTIQALAAHFDFYPGFFSLQPCRVFLVEISYYLYVAMYFSFNASFTLLFLVGFTHLLVNVTELLTKTFTAATTSSIRLV